MTLLIVLFAAIIATTLWYVKDDNMYVGALSLMYWGAVLMWLADAIAEYIKLGADYFQPSLSEIINDAFLGLSVVALGLTAWIIIVLIKDPRGRVRRALTKKK